MSDVERPVISSTSRLGALSLALGVGMFLLVSYTFHGAMAYNPLQLPLEQSVQTQRWLPQGWAFFTRDPHEERLSVYRREASGGWAPAWLTPHGRPENAFGMDRSSRAQGLEVGQLFERLRKAAFQPCQGPLPECLNALEPGTPLQNFMPRKTLCGSIAIVKQQPLPWAWSAWEKRTHMPVLAARLEIRC
jgi:antimicrobial peptide system SdpA family protein